MRGDASYAIEFADKNIKQLREILAQTHSEVTSRSLRTLLALILLEKVRTYMELYLPQELFARSKPIIEEVKEIAKNYEDQRITGLANFHLGDLYYFAGDHGTAIKHLNTALEILKETEYQLAAAQGLAINAAYSNDLDSFEHFASLARKFILENEIPYERACLALEVIARGEGLLGSYQALKTLGKGWDLYMKMESQNSQAPIRAVQLARSGLEIIQPLNLNPTDTNSLVDLGELWLKVAHERRYQRHSQKIEAFLTIHLN